MRVLLSDNSSVRGWYNRNWFVYTTKIGRISELDSDRKELDEIARIKRK
ncbi:MAG: hypothetical protein ABIK93_07335 [candidate division WOR-3 bacterium]